MADESVPLASAAAWLPTAGPQPHHESKVLTLPEDFPGRAATGEDPAGPPEPEAAPMDRLAALREIARKLRSSPNNDETLQFVIDTACACTGSDAAMLTVQAPAQRQFVAGSALGAGPYISVPLRVGGPTFGEIVLTRMSEAAEFGPADETFAELVAEYVAKAISTLRAGTVLSQEEQDFVDRVTEELRSPLAGALNTIVAALEAEPADDVRRTYLTTARADVRRLLETVDNLLRLAHLRPPDLRHMEALPVAPLLDRVVERHRERAAERAITLVHEPPAEALVVQGVAEQVEVAVGALLDNALKFTEAGGCVELSAAPAEGMVRISVRDDGMGFDAAEAARMTDCFARSLSAEAAGVPGLGIGLFLAAEIVKHHSGRLWLESARDQGTRAHVALPPRADA